MKLINRDTDYAIRALDYIAHNGNKIVTVSELVKELKIPRPFLRKILQILNKNGILHSYKGRGGGFVLALKPDKIFLVDLIKIFQGPIQLNECLFRRKICPDLRNCMLKKRIDIIEKRVISDLESITLESLLNGEVYNENMFSGKRSNLK